MRVSTSDRLLRDASMQRCGWQLIGYLGDVLMPKVSARAAPWGLELPEVIDFRLHVIIQAQLC